MSTRTPYEDLIYFVSCALNGVPADSRRAEETDLAALYKAAQRHMLTSLAAAGLESAGIHDEAFTQATLGFLETVREAGWTGMLYNNPTYFYLHLDLSKFVLPPRLKVITVPNYTDAATIRRFKEQCAVQIGIRIYPPRKNRFVRESWR